MEFRPELGEIKKQVRQQAEQQEQAKIEYLAEKVKIRMAELRRMGYKKSSIFFEACNDVFERQGKMDQERKNYLRSKIGQELRRRKSEKDKKIAEEREAKGKPSKKKKANTAESVAVFSPEQLKRMIIDAQHLQWANERRAGSSYKEKGYEAESAPSAHEILKDWPADEE
jgi:hypothetical protein